MANLRYANFTFMQSFTQFRELLDEAWTERFGRNTTRVHDRLDALYGYDSMWLAALAMDMAEARLQNLTPSLTLGDFQYTGENSTIIKNAIYRSGLEVSFTGASVSSDLHKLTLYENHMPCPYTREFKFCIPPYYRASSSSYPMGTELQSWDIFSIGLIMKVKVNDFLLYYCLSQQARLFLTTVNTNIKVSGSSKLDNWMSMTTWLSVLKFQCLQASVT